MMIRDVMRVDIRLFGDLARSGAADTLVDQQFDGLTNSWTSL